ncbi:hypothetical protein CJF67_11990 [Listeria monocytogenes]|nr:hypothetical protein [Listeria monocytogenes]
MLRRSIIVFSIMFNSPLNDKRYHLENYSMIGLWVASKGAFGVDSEFFLLCLKAFLSPLSSP